jgi:hypothetical protein
MTNTNKTTEVLITSQNNQSFEKLKEMDGKDKNSFDITNLKIDSD